MGKQNEVSENSWRLHTV